MKEQFEKIYCILWTGYKTWPAYLVYNCQDLFIYIYILSILSIFQSLETKLLYFLAYLKSVIFINLSRWCHVRLTANYSSWTCYANNFWFPHFIDHMVLDMSIFLRKFNNQTGCSWCLEAMTFQEISNCQYLIYIKLNSMIVL